MGGYNAGEVASGIAVTTVIDAVRRQRPTLKHGSVDPDSGYSVEALTLQSAIQTAHAPIHQVEQSQSQCAGMGTTIVVAELRAAERRVGKEMVIQGRCRWAP